MITFAYITNRENPMWEWYIDSLSRQCMEIGLSDYEVIFVDQLAHKDKRREELYEYINQRFHFQHVEPKPCVWSGRYKLTQTDLFSASNARNTAICHANGDRIVYVDDLSVLDDGFVFFHMRAHKEEKILAGIQRKCYKLIVNKGRVSSYESMNRDSREVVIDNVNLEEIEILDPAWMYSNNFGISIDKALEVNGFDEIYDGQYGIEDCDFSIRLINAGNKIFINQKCRIIESEEHHINAQKRQKAKEINGRHANESICFQARDDKRTWTMGNLFNLGELREKIKIGEKFPIPTEPTLDWRDGQPLIEI